MYSFPMQIAASDSVVSFISGPKEIYFYDRAGRLFAAWHEDWFVRFGLGGKVVAVRWEHREREVKTLAPGDAQALRRQAQLQLQHALARALAPDVKRTFLRAQAFDLDADFARHLAVYKPVGILPPDQYNACVLQVTEGCAWNACHFCSFYAHHPFRLRDLPKIKSHIHQIADYFGDGLSLRSSIFLGDANALTAPVELLLQTIRIAREILVARMPHFRGYYSFIEPHKSQCRTKGDFERLAKVGLRRIYYGLETGNSELRKLLGKPGDLEEVTASLHRAKEAGLQVALILLAGAGGRLWGEKHLQDSIGYLQRLPIDTQDIVFVSPLCGPDGTDGPSCSSAEKNDQITHFRRVLKGKVRVAAYDIREFVY